MKNSSPKPPDHLSREARSLWRRLCDEYGISDAGGLAILAQAGEALDRLRVCQSQIAKDGPIIIDRFGQQKVHPLLSVERDCRSAFLAAIKALGLDIEPLKDRAPWRR